MSVNSPNDFIPVRALSNYVYCPRLFYYQYVENIFVENQDTAEGSFIHRNVDKPTHWKEDMNLVHHSKIRSLSLESKTLGLRGVVDLIENKESGFELIDYKKGSSYRDEKGFPIPKEMDAIQCVAYVLLLREEDIFVKQASIYYAAEKKRVPVILDDSLFKKCFQYLKDCKKTALSSVCPKPLIDDPRCLHCSAYSVCLPNESAFWSGLLKDPPKNKQTPRPALDDREILVVQNPKAKIKKKTGKIVVEIENKTISRHPIEQIQNVYLYGTPQISSQTVQALLERNIPIGYFSPAGRFLGMTQGLSQSGIDARKGQYHLFENPSICLKLIREIIRCKIHNQRVILMRNGKASQSALQKLAHLRDKAKTAESIEIARGFEGSASAFYFQFFNTMIKKNLGKDFDFKGRNRRPPKDPVNALLSQGYSILVKELTGISHVVGLDPFFGFFHQPRYGRPALALDLMEEFRPLLADSVAISLLNRKELNISDFQLTSKGVFLNDRGRKQFWNAWFRRMDTQVKHPQFGYRMSYRRMLIVQARQLWRFLRGESQTYYGFTTR